MILIAVMASMVNGTLSVAVAQEAAPPQKVEIFGSHATESDITSFKTIMRRADIERFGDPQIVDVLRRMPGITVTPIPGKGVEVQLRGLGSGYTRLLINGEAIPAGFALDAIASAQVDRIEIQRASTADSSAQSIAGSINIVLKSASAVAEAYLQTTGGWQSDRPNVTVDARWSAKDGPWRKHTFVSVAREFTESLSNGIQTAALAGVTSAQQIDSASRADSTTLNLGSGLQYKQENAWSWSLEGSLRHKRISELALEHRKGGLAPADIAEAQTTSGLATTSIQLQGQANRTFEAGSQLEASATVTAHQREMNSSLSGRNAAEDVALARIVDSVARTRTLMLSGKYATPLNSEHDAVFGWYAESAWRSEDRAQSDYQPIPQLQTRANDSYASSVYRIALFGQDDYRLSKEISVYGGLRGELIQTDTIGSGLSKAGQRSSVLGPIFQVAFKPNGSEDLIFRGSVSRTFKSPDPRDLIPRRWLSNVNDPLHPDEEGNADLRAELAWGLDAAVEAKLAPAVEISINAYARQIENVILNELIQTNGRWLERKANAGSCAVTGIEFDARADLQKSIPSLPKIALTSYVGLNHSRLLDVSDGVRRMDQSAPALIRFGWEHRLTGSSIRWGGQYQYEKGALVRYANFETRKDKDISTMDLFATWNPAKDQTLRLSISNLLGSDRVSKSRTRVDDLDYDLARHDKQWLAFKLVWRVTL